MSYYCPQCGSTKIKSNSDPYPKQESDKDTAVMMLMGAILGSIVPVLGTILGAVAGWLTGEAMSIFGSASYLTPRENLDARWTGFPTVRARRGLQTTKNEEYDR